MFHEVFRFLPREQLGFASQDPEINQRVNMRELFQADLCERNCSNKNNLVKFAIPGTNDLELQRIFPVTRLKDCLTFVC